MEDDVMQHHGGGLKKRKPTEAEKTERMNRLNLLFQQCTLTEAGAAAINRINKEILDGTSRHARKMLDAIRFYKGTKWEIGRASCRERV